VAERAERERHYRRVGADAAREEAAHAARSRHYSRFRLAVFLVSAGLLLWGTLGRQEVSSALVSAAIAGFVVFGVAVFAHDRVERSRIRAAARRECAEIALARMARDWTAVPPPFAPIAADDLASATAADLDVDGAASLMALVGSLAGPAGQVVLRHWLVDPPQDPDRIAARQEAAKVLARTADFREAFTAEVRLSSSCPNGAGDRARFLTWAGDPRSALGAPAVRWVVRLWTAATVIAAAGAGLGGGPWTRAWLPLALAAFLASLVTSRRVQSQLDAASLGPSTAGTMASLMRLAEAVPTNALQLQAIQGRLSRPASAAAAFESLARRVGWSELRRGAPVIHLPLQALLLWDFHALFALDDWRARHGSQVRPWLDAVAELDALVALGTLAHDEPGWAFPLIEDGDAGLDAAALGHPLLPHDRRVGNDVKVGPPGTVLLVTGSNMAGKSTLLRSIGTNVMLANAGAPVCATRLRLARVRLATSLRTADSLSLGVSGYMAGLLRLKQIVEAARAATTSPSGHPAVLYLLDEVLGGTNSEERRIAVRAIARELLACRAVGALTTHDLALADDPALREAAVRVHFRETVEHGDDGAVRMTFDYQLRPGLATSTNALALLRSLGLPPSS
jgi:hypothetical protein